MSSNNLFFILRLPISLNQGCCHPKSERRLPSLRRSSRRDKATSFYLGNARRRLSGPRPARKRRWEPNKRFRQGMEGSLARRPASRRTAEPVTRPLAHSFARVIGRPERRVPLLSKAPQGSVWRGLAGLAWNRLRASARKRKPASLRAPTPLSSGKQDCGRKSQRRQSSS